MRDPFGWHTVDEATLHDIRNKLSNFESMTINEIFVTSRAFHHPVQRNKLCPEAQKRLAELHLDDIDELHSLRLTGKQRVWGILYGNVMALLWWEPEHEVCPSLLKNT